MAKGSLMCVYKLLLRMMWCEGSGGGVVNGRVLIKGVGLGAGDLQLDEQVSSFEVLEIW